MSEPGRDGAAGEGRQLLDRATSEKDFMQTVIDFARLNRWKVFHVFDSRKCEPGWPDLVLVGPITAPLPWRVIYAELKTERGQLTPAQMAWRDTLRDAGQEWHLWRPKDFDEIERVLRGV